MRARFHGEGKTPDVTWFYRNCLRPILFAQDSESIHDRTLRWLHWISESAPACECLDTFFKPPSLPVDLFGLRFPNPVGLAAGMDKHAAAVPAWEAMGFGFVELGGVTWHAQPGNPKPRMFRAAAESALVNRMGFNNPGAAAFAETLAHWKRQGRWPRHPVGVNLGKSKRTPLEEAPQDYQASFRLLRSGADFFVVNVSSPNTPNLRRLQDKALLDEILAALQDVQRASARVPRDDVSVEHCHAKPILVKVAPDLSFDALDEILELAAPRDIAGIVATNTTVARPETSDTASRRAFSESGGLSGRPLRERSTEVIRHLYRQTQGTLPIIGVGGIFNVADAWEKILAGASLVQVYTGLVYEGPGLARTIAMGLRRQLERLGLARLTEAVGQAALDAIT